MRQALRAPYATSLTAAPVGARFAWVESVEGVHNLWVGGPKVGGPKGTARQLTHFTADDGKDIAQLAWAPDGEAVAFVYGAEIGAAGKPANPAHLQETPVVEVRVKPLAGDEVVIGEGRSPIFLHDGAGLLYVRQGQIWISDWKAKSVATNQLVFDRGSASQMTLSPDGTRLAFVSRRREANQPSHSYIAVFDLGKKTLGFLGASTGNDFAPSFSHDGTQLAWLRAPFTEAPEFAVNRVSANPWSVEVANVATGETHAVYQPEAKKPGSVLPHLATGEPKIFWAADGRIVFYSEADGWVHLYALDLKRPGLPLALTPGKYEVEDATVSGDGRALVYAANDTLADPLHPEPLDADRRHLWGLDLTQAQPTPVFLTRGAGNEVHPALSANGAVLAALVADTHTPMMPALIDAEGKRSPLRAVAGQAAMVVPQQVLLTAKDGVKVHAQLFVSPPPKAALTADNHGGGKKRAALIFVHGGPRRQMLLGYPAMEYYSNAYAMNQYLAARGFVVLSVNYRCGIGYGLNFRQCEHGGADGAAEYSDVLAAVAYLRGRGDVDAKRIGIWGGSYGGYLTAMGLARNSELFAAGVDFHGVHEWALEDNAAADWLHGPGWNPTTPAALAVKAHASSPMSELSRWKSPVLMIHGDDDANVSYAQTPLLADALRARGVPVEELIFPDEIHEFLLHKDWVAAYEAEASFLVRTLKP